MPVCHSLLCCGGMSARFVRPDVSAVRPSRSFRDVFMLRFCSTALLLAVAFSALWENHAPPEQQAKMPPSMQRAVTTVNATSSHVVAALADLLVDKMASSVPAAEGMGPAITSRRGDAPLRTVDGDGIAVVHTDLSTEDLLAGNFDRTRLLGAALVDANLSYADLSGALLDSAQADNAVFGDADLRQASARVARFDGAVFYRATLDGATMEGARFADAIFRSSSFKGTEFSAGLFEDSVFTGGNGTRARFVGAAADGARFEDVRLRHADFRRASLRRAVFNGTDLSGAHWTGADLSGADMAKATGLTPQSMTGACGDAGTKLPAGLPALPLCGSAPAPAPQMASLPAGSGKAVLARDH